MNAADRYGEILDAVSRSLRGLPEAHELAAELRRLGDEIRVFPDDHPVDAGLAIAMGMTGGARSAAAPLMQLAAEMIADHAPDSGWSGHSLFDYLRGLGRSRAADFLSALADAIGPRG